jgi:hypothetical protein
MGTLIAARKSAKVTRRRERKAKREWTISLAIRIKKCCLRD